MVSLTKYVHYSANYIEQIIFEENIEELIKIIDYEHSHYSVNDIIKLCLKHSKYNILQILINNLKLSSNQYPPHNCPIYYLILHDAQIIKNLGCSHFTKLSDEDKITHIKCILQGAIITNNFSLIKQILTNMGSHLDEKDFGDILCINNYEFNQIILEMMECMHKNKIYKILHEMTHNLSLNNQLFKCIIEKYGIDDVDGVLIGGVTYACNIHLFDYFFEKNSDTNNLLFSVDILKSAVESGSLHMVKYVVNKGFVFYLLGPYIALAIKTNSIDILEYLLDKSLHPSQKIKSRILFTALSDDNFDVVRMLTEYGMEIDAKTFFSATRHGFLDIAELFLANNLALHEITSLEVILHVTLCWIKYVKDNYYDFDNDNYHDDFDNASNDYSDNEYYDDFDNEHYIYEECLLYGITPETTTRLINILKRDRDIVPPHLIEFIKKFIILKKDVSDCYDILLHIFDNPKYSHYIPIIENLNNDKYRLDIENLNN